jgi:hypothetical protein
MTRVMILLILACAAAGALAADKQQVYKWTDANGVVHFSDAPPPTDTKNVQSLHLAGGTTTSGAAPAGNAAVASTAAPGATTTAVPAAAGDNATLCKQARSNLELLQSKTPVGIAGADGKAEALDDKARQAQIDNAKLAISRFCK